MATAFQKRLVKACGGCVIQTTDRYGWPCGTCFGEIPLRVSSKRRGELWRSVLVHRGDYTLASANEGMHTKLTQTDVDANIAWLDSALIAKGY